MDSQPVNLDGFAFENHELGLASLASPGDPEPSLLVRGGRVIELDSRPADESDMLDEFIARHGLDLRAAAEAMALDDVEIARLMVDPSVPRRSLVELAGSLTPAKLARMVALLQPHELMMAGGLTRCRCGGDRSWWRHRRRHHWPPRGGRRGRRRSADDGRGGAAGHQSVGGGMGQARSWRQPESAGSGVGPGRLLTVRAAKT